MPRKKRKTTTPKLPLNAGEVWEIGQRPLTTLASLPDDAVPALPTMLFVVQADSGHPILGAPLMPGAPSSDFVDLVRRAMREPMEGEPRRPAVMRVSSEAEADALRTGLAETDITIEVTEVLEAVDEVHASAMNMFGHVHRDYRTHAKAAGDRLSDAGLHALYGVARQFYRKALWEGFDDSEIFSITFPTIDGDVQTNYGVLIGSMGEEFGLALYATLEELQQVYDLDVDALEAFPMSLDEDDFNEGVWEADADLTAQLLSVPSLSMTYTSKRDLPRPLLEEAKALKLPVAKQSAYPLMVRTGQGMRLANLPELRQIFIALHAILAWNQQIEALDPEDDLDETLTVEVPAMADALQALTAEVTLIVNPFTEDDDFDDDDDDDFDDDEPLVSIDANRMRALFDPSLLDDLADSEAPTPRIPKGKSKTTAKKADGQSPTAKSNRVYTLKVFLTGGPLEEDQDEEISREILLLGHHTLHDLHLAIFDAFERWEDHLYEFNLGSSPQDRSRLYFYNGGWDHAEDDAGDPTITALDALDLSESQYFGYTFDMGDQWEHVIEVISIKSGAGQKTYPQVGKKVGTAPPQYPDDEAFE